MSGDLYTVTTGNGIVAQDVNQYQQALARAATAPSLVQTLALSAASNSLPGVRMCLFGQRYLAVPEVGKVDIVDLTDPTNASIIVTLTLPAGAQATACACVGHLLFVTDAHNGAIRVFDVTDPAVPLTLGAVSSVNSGDIVALGQYLVTTQRSGNLVSIWDAATYVSASSTMTKLLDVTLANPPGGLAIIDATHVAITCPASNSLYTIEVPSGTVKSNGTLNTFNSPLGIVAVGKYLAVVNSATSALAGHEPQASVSLVNCADVANPSIVTRVSVADGPQNIVAMGRLLLTTNGNVANTLSVIDATTPTAPSLVSSTAIGGGPNAAITLGRYAITLNQAAVSLSILDLTGLDIAAARLSGASIGQLWVDEDAHVAGTLQAARLDTAGPVRLGADVAVAGILTLGTHVVKAPPATAPSVGGLNGVTGAQFNTVGGTLVADDTRGVVCFTLPASFTGPLDAIRLNYGTAYRTPPVPVITDTPASSPLGSMTPATQYEPYIGHFDTTGFTIGFNGTLPASPVNVQFTYHVIG